jgi:hypothetical protein
MCSPHLPVFVGTPDPSPSFSKGRGRRGTLVTSLSPHCSAHICFLSLPKGRGGIQPYPIWPTATVASYPYPRGREGGGVGTRREVPQFLYQPFLHTAHICSICLRRIYSQLPGFLHSGHNFLLFFYSGGGGRVSRYGTPDTSLFPLLTVALYPFL